MRPVRLVLREGREGLYASLTIEYQGGLPRAPARRKAILSFLGECKKRIEAGECVDIGQADNFTGRPMLRRDDWLIEREGE